MYYLTHVSIITLYALYQVHLRYQRMSGHELVSYESFVIH